MKVNSTPGVSQVGLLTPVDGLSSRNIVVPVRDRPICSLIAKVSQHIWSISTCVLCIVVSIFQLRVNPMCATSVTAVAMSRKALQSDSMDDALFGDWH